MTTDDRTILIVDDQKLIQQILGEILKGFANIEYASSGEEALDKIKISKPDLILLDVTMPGMDGFDVCRCLKKDKETSDIPIVILTGNDSNKHEIKALQEGATDFLRKPITPEIVYVRVGNILKLQAATRELRILAQTDPLTGAYNRRHFWEIGSAETQRYKRYNSIFSVMMLDIDHFKNVNDTYGHDVGDIAIKKTVEIIKNELRIEDTLGRLGGEEFAVILPETKNDKASFVAERIRAAISKLQINTEKGGLAFTLSIGIAEINLDDKIIDDVIKHADDALYEAKETGRNKVVSPTKE